MSLIGNTYIQATDPGAVGFGYVWANSDTGEVWTRDTTNSSWIPQGNWNYSHSGNLPLTGGIMTGPIMTTGVSSWAPINSPNFTGTPQKSGLALATTTDVSTAVSGINASINSKISQAIASTSAAITIGNNVAWGYGEALHGATIPLPQYSNGDDATVGEMVILMGAIRDLNVVTYSGLSYEWVINCEINPATLVASCYGYKNDSPGDTRTGTLSYIIVCAR